MSDTRVMITVSTVDSLRVDGPRDLGGEPNWAVHDEYRRISVWINRAQLRELAHDLWVAEAEAMRVERDAAAAQPEPGAAPAPAEPAKAVRWVHAACGATRPRFPNDPLDGRIYCHTCHGIFSWDQQLVPVADDPSTDYCPDCLHLKSAHAPNSGAGGDHCAGGCWCMRRFPAAVADAAS